MSSEPQVERVDVEKVVWDVWTWVTQNGNYPPVLLGSYTSRDAALAAQPPYGDRMTLLKVSIPAGWLR